MLLDIGMPQLDGYAVCRQIRSQAWGQSLPLIALTGFGQEADKQRSWAAGFDGHLLKPVDYTALSELLTKTIATKKGN
ncbi:MAG: response regulator [Spirosoma sp.]|nr:response regulator [Spirosoma sp.]